MTYKTRKRIWPAAVVSLAVFGLLAAVFALSIAQTPAAQADGCGDGERPEGESQTDCLIRHGSESLNPSDPDHEHVTNRAPVTSMPELDPVTIVGVMVKDADGNDVYNTHTVAGVQASFSDPDEGDALTFTVGSSNTDAATGMLDDDGDLVITAQDAGEATVTVTATDPDGATATSTIMVTVRLSPAERYHLWHAADPMKLANFVEFDAPATQQVTFTVSAVDADASPLDEDATVNFVMQQFPVSPGNSPLVTRVIGWDSSTDSNIEDDDIMQGLLTVRATDPDGERGFTVYFRCVEPGDRVEIDMLDEGPELVAEATIGCAVPPVPPPPPDRYDVSDPFTVASYDDWMYHDATDGFVVTDAAGNPHLVNAHPTTVTGWLTRDEPVIHSQYTLGVSNVEYLGNLDNGDPRRAAETGTRHARNAAVEEGQRTVEVLVGAPHVQLTVTAMESGPAYIRFLNSDMRPFGTDVDEEPMWRGADVVGLDSQGRLNLNMEVELSEAMALAYDQYEIVTPGIVPDRRPANSYLRGNDGAYNQGTFRFFNPCPEVGHHFYVEVYERDGKYLETTEKVVCINPPGIVPSELSVTTFSDRAGDARLEWVEAIGATAHHVIVLDMTDPMRPLPVAGTYDRVVAPVTVANISGLSEGVEYRFAVAAERRDASGSVTYSMPSFIDQIMDWE